MASVSMYHAIEISSACAAVHHHAWVLIYKHKVTTLSTGGSKGMPEQCKAQATLQEAAKDGQRQNVHAPHLPDLDLQMC